MGRTLGKNEKLESFEKSGVRKFPFNFESTDRNWKVSHTVLSNQKLSNLKVFNFQLRVFQLPFPTTCMPKFIVRLAFR